mmetsp:Transcript_37880/g.84433  ORF Transcript_37880/g.84433 Transcript_37880/m.84433 type:complete len:113 (+) Transcript_37880:226-564(+)
MHVLLPPSTLCRTAWGDKAHIVLSSGSNHQYEPMLFIPFTPSIDLTLVMHPMQPAATNKLCSTPCSTCARKARKSYSALPALQLHAKLAGTWEVLMLLPKACVWHGTPCAHA